MSVTRQVRPWFWSALLVSLLGAVAGALMAVVALQTFAARAQALSTFERVWSEAVAGDMLATRQALGLLAGIGSAAEQQDDFREIGDDRGKQFLDAMALAPGADLDFLDRIYAAVQQKAAFEDAAVAYAANGKVETGRRLLEGSGYVVASREMSELLHVARTEVAEALKAEAEQARLMLALAVLILAGTMLAGGLCWLRVGRLFRAQAVDLAAAHQTLAAHAGELEQRITERTRDLEAAKQAAESADQAKSAFLAQMSHEIRTPLNGVLGMADVLAQTRLEPDQGQMVDVIRSSGTTLLALLNDVLDLAKIEAGRVELECIDYSVTDIVRSTEAVFAARAAEKGIALCVELEPEAAIWCRGDPTRVRQVLYNLLSNAVKFTQAGTVAMKVSAQPRPDGALRVRYVVHDTGIGIEQEVLDRLFSRFTQADARTTRKFGGTGLGLAISAELADLMNGDITVSSAMGQGSVFTFELDCLRGEAPARTDAQAFERSFEATGEDSGDLRILAAEDNPQNRMVLKLLLEQVGIEPVFAENGRIAVEMWQAQAFDMILMDVQMPEMSGPDATRAIRRIEAETGRTRTPIIALTANAMTHHVRECLESGMDAHVAKPVRPDILFAAIHAALESAETGAPTGMAASDQAAA